MKVIGFCFLIYDTIIHEEVWHAFFKNIDKSKYKIYIHYKEDVELKYFNDYKIPKEECIETKYADISLTIAQNVMYQKAFDDGCFKVVNISQACVPFKNFNHLYDFLSNNEKGHINFGYRKQLEWDGGIINQKNRCIKVQERKQYKRIDKTSQWMVLNRACLKHIMSIPREEIERIWEGIFAPEEHFYVMEFIHNNMMDNFEVTYNSSDGTTTFANWPGMSYRFSDTSYYKQNPGKVKNYDKIGADELYHLCQAKCLFGRKFTEKSKGYFINNSKYISHISS